jgi:hypothetical protein
VDVVAHLAAPGPAAPQLQVSELPVPGIRGCPLGKPVPIEVGEAQLRAGVGIPAGPCGRCPAPVGQQRRALIPDGYPQGSLGCAANSAP